MATYTINGEIIFQGSKKNIKKVMEFIEGSASEESNYFFNEYLDKFTIKESADLDFIKATIECKNDNYYNYISFVCLIKNAVPEISITCKGFAFFSATGASSNIDYTFESDEIINNSWEAVALDLFVDGEDYYSYESDDNFDDDDYNEDDD